MSLSQVRCIHQILRSQSHIQGFGNCRTCTHDEGNKHCRYYAPARWRLYEVKDKGTVSQN